MRARTHQQIAMAVVTELHLPGGVAEEFVGASAEPDNKRAQFPRRHHTKGREHRGRCIWDLTRRARQALLLGHEHIAARMAGYALHFVADEQVMSSGDEPDHHRFEEACDRVRLPEPTRAAEAKRYTADEVRALAIAASESVREDPPHRAREAVKRAYAHSLALAAAADGPSVGGAPSLRSGAPPTAACC